VIINAQEIGNILRCQKKHVDFAGFIGNSEVPLFFPSDPMTLNSKPLKPNGKLEVPVEVAISPPRTTLLGTIFSPVFNFFSPATKTGNRICLKSHHCVLCLFFVCVFQPGRLVTD
jgi:hypothetical protein